MLILTAIPDSLSYPIIQDEIESIRHLVETSNDVISNELSSANLVMAIVAIVVAVVVTGLGIYVSYLSSKIKKMTDSVSAKSKEVEALAKTVNETDKKIQSDIKGLYSQLRKEESLALLKRLEIEPLDIENLADQLLSRELGEEGYLLVQNAYRKLKKFTESEYQFDKTEFGDKRPSYLILFYQHYIDRAIVDNEIRPDLVGSFKLCLQSAFKRDVINSTIKLCQALSDPYADFDKEDVLVSYLKAINESKFGDYSPLKDIFEDNITNSGLLVNAIENCTKQGIYLKIFGITPENKNIITKINK